MLRLIQTGQFASIQWSTKYYTGKQNSGDPVTIKIVAHQGENTKKRNAE